jgi:hypothetical protein
MRKKWIKNLLPLGLVILGMAMLIVAVFAYQLHIDNNPAMGVNRIVLAEMGGTLELLAAFIVMFPYIRRFFEKHFSQRIKARFSWLGKPYRWLIEPDEEKGALHQKNRGVGIYAFTGAAISIFICLWFISSGRITTWYPSTTFFDRQANAYLAGQIALLEKPPAALANLENPYTLANRGGITGYYWDSSYYQGKYYYYWGPVSGLMATALKLFHRDWLIQDSYLVFISVCGLAVILAALFTWLQKRFFPRLPGLLVMAVTMLGVLNTPVFWLINRPVVHDPPISAGQFFLVLGIYALLRGLDSKTRRWPWMVLAGFSWGAAIGSRYNLAVGIAWMGLLLVLFLFTRAKNGWSGLQALIPLLIPLILWGAGLAWYNYARFGNILETGHRYQLTGNSLPANYHDITSISYVLPNLYNLVARPFTINWNEFPFFFAPWIRNNMWPRLIFFPRNTVYFYGEPIAGIFPSMPVNWCLIAAAVVIPLGMARRNTWIGSKLLDFLRTRPLYVWLVWMLAGAVLFELAFLSIFIFSTMRYLADLTPSLTLLLFLCLGWLSVAISSRPRLWRSILVLVSILIFISIIISLFSSFQSGDYLFQSGNPALYKTIRHFFSGD